jgi:LPXTG-motif cell wall-anchored protein
MKAKLTALHTWTTTAFALAMLGLTAGASLAAIPPSTAYRFSSHPMISGTVVTVNDHQMVVNTDQGQQVTLELDTRTMAPRDLGPGMTMRAEFLALEDCRFYAQRITPIRGGMSTERTQAYAGTRDSREVVARNATGYESGRETRGTIAADADRRVNLPQQMGVHSPGAMMTATPNTADYGFSDRPLMSGRVLSVNDHRLVIATNQGQTVGMVMDSRTMVPREVAPGTFLRVEFKRMADGRYYAKRVNLLNGSEPNREQAYSQTRDSDFVVAQNSADCGFTNARGSDASVSNTEPVERREIAPATRAVVAQSEPVQVEERAETPAETLPQTASQQSLLLLLGLSSVGAAGFITILRGLRGA